MFMTDPELPRSCGRAFPGSGHCHCSHRLHLHQQGPCLGSFPLQDEHGYHIYHQQLPSSPAKQHTPVHTLLPLGRGREIKLCDRCYSHCCVSYRKMLWCSSRGRQGSGPQFSAAFFSFPPEIQSLHRFHSHGDTLFSGTA